MTRRMAVGLLISSLTFECCIGLADHPSEPAGAPVANSDSEVIGWLDRVEGKPRIGGSVNIVGWAASQRAESTVRKIEILLDGLEIAETIPGLERPDVAHSYGNPRLDRSGWERQVVLDKILPGEHEIEAVALDSAGARHLLRGARSIVVLDSR